MTQIPTAELAFAAGGRGAEPGQQPHRKPSTRVPTEERMAVVCYRLVGSTGATGSPTRVKRRGAQHEYFRVTHDECN